MSTRASTTPRSNSRGPLRLLTLDIGNSRAKLRAWAAREARPARTFELDLPLNEHRDPRENRTEDRDEALVETLITRLPRELEGVPCALTSVGRPEQESAAAEALRARGHPVLRTPDPALRIACEPPEDVGRDRLYAARGALSLAGGIVCVVDSGTALTVDLAQERVHPGGRSEQIFLGGAIAPGPTLLARALSEWTVRLPRVEPQPGARALGTSTRDALRAGSAVGFRGAARELVEGVLAELEITDDAADQGVSLFLTGGATPFLLQPGPFTKRPFQFEPDLVHLGLYFASGGATVGVA